MIPATRIPGFSFGVIHHRRSLRNPRDSFGHPRWREASLVSARFWFLILHLPSVSKVSSQIEGIPIGGQFASQRTLPLSQSMSSDCGER